MAKDSVTVTSRTSWLERLGGSIKGIVVGILIVLVSFPFLFWNEGRAVDRYKTLDEGARDITEISSEALNPTHEDTLVYTTGEATTNSTITDPDFQITVPGLKMKRTIEMYQWIEETDTKTQTNLGGSEETTTTYSYTTDWSGTLQDSSQFQNPTGHTNPPVLPYENITLSAEPIMIDVFTLHPDILTSLQSYEAYSLPEDDLNQIRQQTQRSAQVTGPYLSLGDPQNPQIGDVRIKYETVSPQQVSVVAKQSDSMLVPYQTSNGSLSLLSTGTVPVEQMFETARQGNAFMTWILRIGGFLLMAIGLSMILKPLAILADVVPFIGSIVRFGTGLVAGTGAFVLSVITIAIAWVLHRPLVSLILVVGAVLIAGGISYFRMNKSTTTSKT